MGKCFKNKPALENWWEKISAKIRYLQWCWIYTTIRRNGTKCNNKVNNNWWTINAKEEQCAELRVRVPEKQTVYKTQVAMRQGGTFIRKAREAPELIGEALHCWPNKVTYTTLTHDEVQKSVLRTDAVNSLSEDILQATLADKQAQ